MHAAEGLITAPGLRMFLTASREHLVDPAENPAEPCNHWGLFSMDRRLLFRFKVEPEEDMLLLQVQVLKRSGEVAHERLPSYVLELLEMLESYDPCERHAEYLVREDMPDEDINGAVEEIRLLQHISRCGCGRGFVGKEEICKCCMLTSREEQLRSEECVVCRSPVLRLYSHREQCCGVYMHTACARQLSSSGYGAACVHCQAVKKAPLPFPSDTEESSDEEEYDDEEVVEAVVVA